MKKRRVIVLLFIGILILTVFRLMDHQSVKKEGSSETVKADNEESSADMPNSAWGDENETRTWKICEVGAETTEDHRYALPDDFPDDMVFADNETFETIKRMYDGIDFHGEFQEGNTAVYDYYRDKYARLLKSEVEYIVEKGVGPQPEFRHEGRVSDHYNTEEELATGDFTKIYFFDMDEDEAPELCLTGTSGIYIFKYIPETDRYYEWWELKRSGLNISGSRKIVQNDLDEFFVFHQLNKKGKMEFDVKFAIRYFGSEHGYVVGLPYYYGDEAKQIEMSEKMRQQSYFAYFTERYFFRVTKEQFDELTTEYFKTEELSDKEKVDYSYFFQ